MPSQKQLVYVRFIYDIIKQHLSRLPTFSALGKETLTFFSCSFIVVLQLYYCHVDAAYVGATSLDALLSFPQFYHVLRYHMTSSHND